VRLRLTVWYGGLFLVSGAALIAFTYFLIVRAAVGHSDSNVLCRSPGGASGSGSGCHAAGASQTSAAVLHQRAALLHEFVSRSEIALGIVTAIALLLGWYMAGRALRPLRTVTAAAREMSAGRLDERVALPGPRDEFKELGDTFDGLLARLESSFHAQRQFIANAAHELRTPLARQRVISQVAVADPGASVESLSAAHERVLISGAEQQQLIDALLALAEGQSGLDTWERFDLSPVAAMVVADRQQDAAGLNLTVHAVLDTALVAGSRRLCERLISNLVDNALRYNVPGGEVEITTGTVGQGACVSVVNTGPVVSATAVDEMFRPFQRLSDHRRGEGFGLGLSIVEAVVHAHHASVEVQPRPEGGLRIEVVFPPAPSESDDPVVGRPGDRPTTVSAHQPTASPSLRKSEAARYTPFTGGSPLVTHSGGGLSPAARPK
jgi:signal transduction histidine kinase